jgi:phosphate transporter
MLDSSNSRRLISLCQLGLKVQCCCGLVGGIYRVCSIRYTEQCTFLNPSQSYDVLKRYIYQLEKQQQQRHGIDSSYHDLEANEQTALVDHTEGPSPDSLFKPLLDKELEKITLFYEAQEKELMDELAELEQSIAQLDESGLAAGLSYMDEYEEDDDEDDEEDEVAAHGKPPRRRHRKSSSVGYETRFPQGLPCKSNNVTHN